MEIRWTKQTNPEIENFAIMLPSGSGHSKARCVGVVGVIRTDPQEIGYMLHSQFWGKGYASEAVALFIPEYWRRRPTVDFIEAHIDPENKSSIRIAEKFGFKLTNEHADDYVHPSRGKRSYDIYTLDRPIVSPALQS